MITETNIMGVPEIRNYECRVIEGAVIVTYEVRGPGERDWQPVRLISLTSWRSYGTRIAGQRN
ncbi:MAG TPA: hypothetical protein VGR22_04385 [Thermomicrobiales bacterium]|nr:hypothetical protein [Thermomicrobiales bacterium]